MTKQKAFKRRVRAEALRTGKSYQATRARLEKERTAVSVDDARAVERAHLSLPPTSPFRPNLNVENVGHTLVHGHPRTGMSTFLVTDVSDLAGQTDLFAAVLAACPTKIF